MNEPGIKENHAILKHTQTIVMFESKHQKLKQITKVNVTADMPHRDRYVTFDNIAHNTTYHQSLKCTLTEISHGRLITYKL